MKHGFNTWENYLRVHEKVLKQYSVFFVNPLVVYELNMSTENYYTLILERVELKTNEGKNIFVKIEKDIDVQAGVTRKIARTYRYSYNSWKKTDRNNANFIRYCSPHLDHNQFHHKHDFTVTPPTITKIRNDDWPHVSEFFDELISIYLK